MDTIEQNHRLFFANDGKEPGSKNKAFIKAFKKIKNRKQSDIKNELYDVISTFGVTTASTHNNLCQLIETELKNIDWYKTNNHDVIAQAIPDYIVGYCLFNYALPLPDMKLLQLYYKIKEPDFFYRNKKSQYLKDGKLLSRNIKKAIDKIISQYLSIYPNLKSNTSILDFSDLVNFSESYLNFIKSLDLNTR
jgi:ATP-dependent exoDNAse (exonuclease V) beta subunit